MRKVHKFFKRRMKDLSSKEDILLLKDQNIINKIEEVEEKLGEEISDLGKQFEYNHRELKQNDYDSLSNKDNKTVYFITKNLVTMESNVSSLSSGTLRMSVKLTDKDNNLKYSSCKYIINNSASSVGTNASSYTDGTLTGETTNITKLTSNTDNYLHVLAVDNSGNKVEIISNKLKLESFSQDFNYTGNVQSISLNPGTYKLECWGAEGGTWPSETSTTHQNGGGYSVGTLGISKETPLFIYVGGKGESKASSALAYGGWNGGGANRGAEDYNSGGRRCH